MRIVRLRRSPSYPCPGVGIGTGTPRTLDRSLRAHPESLSVSTSPSPAHDAMAHVGSRKHSRSRSRSRGRESEKKRKKSSKDAPRSCSASRSHGRKASATSSGAEGEARKEWERGAGTSWKKQTAGSWAGFLGPAGGVAVSRTRAVQSAGRGYLDGRTQHPGRARPQSVDRLMGAFPDAVCASGPGLWGLAAMLQVRQ